LVEQFKPGAVYHCDGLNLNGKTLLFSLTSQYLATPMEISQGGGIFRSANIPYNSADDREIKKGKRASFESFWNETRSHIIPSLSNVMMMEKFTF
jgi:hypothetical protein